MNDEDLLTSGALFHAVQLARVFPDSKTFPDCIATAEPGVIEQAFRALVGDFVARHFSPPEVSDTPALAPVASLAAHIDRLWPLLTRMPDPPDERSSLIPLPFPYVVPGGRFREIYYWDSYFTAEGLAAAGRLELVEHMVANFAALIDGCGYVPNGNRRYYLGRSQPPMFCAMLQLLERCRGFDAVRPYVAHLEREYRFWMEAAAPAADGRARRRVVALGDGAVLNRYWDEHDGPRPESFLEDIETHARAEPAHRPGLYRNLRAGAESGWDFSSRWFGPGGGLESIRCTELLPVDLNALLWLIERRLAEWLDRLGEARAAEYARAADARRAALFERCWSETEGWFFDHHWPSGVHSEAWTLAGAFPLYCGMVEPGQSARMAAILEQRFLRAGGLVTTLTRSGEQWDAPNGWAPLQWVAVEGLRRYGHERLAREIATRFVGLAEDVWRRTGKMMEKYDVCDPAAAAGGGEYPVQDGFGWTNGVVRGFIRLLGAT